MTNRETNARKLYGVYCDAIGGRSTTGAPLPDWNAFRDNPENRKQIKGWLAVGERADKMIRDILSV